MQGIDSDLIRGHIDTIILKVLFEGDRYGYEICKEVEEKSNGAYELKQPTLYSCLKRLEAQGLISSYWEESDIGGKRHYYKLTEEGRKTFQDNYDEWTRSRAIIDNLISNPFVKDNQTQEKIQYVVDEEKMKKAVEEAYNKGLTEGKQSSNANANQDEKQAEIVSSLLSSTYTDEGDVIPWKTEENSDEVKEEVSSFAWHDNEDAVVVSSANGEEVEAIPSPEENVNHPYEDEELPFSEEVSKAQASFFESNDEPLTSNEETKQIEHSEETALSYDDRPLLDAPEEKEEEAVPFVFNLDGYTLRSNESYFESEDMNDPKPDYTAPQMRIDGLEEKKEEAEDIGNVSAPVYHDFGADTLIKKHEDEVWVDDSDLDADSIYLNPDIVKEEEPEKEVTLFEDDVQKEEETPEEEDYSKPAESEEVVELEENEESAGNSAFMDFYKSTDGYDNLDPSYTDEESREKLSSLMGYGTNVKEEPKEYTQSVMSYAQLKADFEKEGLVVKEHKKHLKESKETRSYVESNKLNLVTSWTTFGIVAFLLTLTYFITTNYRANYNSALSTLTDTTYSYFLIGMGLLAIVPIIYTIIFIINPYKKKPARYAFRIYMLFAVLLTVQLLIIIYCVNLQLGFYSFTRPTYNHLFWIVPCVMSLYPILDAILHNVYFKSKNFHV